MTRFLKRSLLLVVPAAMAALVLTVPASAGPDGTGSASGVTSPALLSLIANDDLFSTMNLSTVLDPTGTTPTQHYGPYPSGSPDSGTCGNNWAEDTYNRDFTVRAERNGSYTVVEQFKHGSFVTTTGTSPAACDPTYTNHGTTIRGGVVGSMHGYFIVPGVLMQTSTSPYCDAVTMTNAGCTTTTFINTHFTPCYPATCSVTTFFDHYAAGDQGLIYNEWKNATTDRGGNGGDIASG
jgi:hypothetical protein